MSTEVTASELSIPGGVVGVRNDDPFRFLAIDGVLPTLANVVNGYYPYFSTGSWYTIKSGSNIPTGYQLYAFKAIQGDIGEPFAMEVVNANYANRPWGAGGDLVPIASYCPIINGRCAPTNHANYTSFPVTTSEVENNPINLYTKASSGTVNNCDAPVLSGNINTVLTNSTAVEGAILGRGNVNQH